MALRVGFVDYNLENFHANKFIELFHGELQQHGIEVAYCYGMIEEPSREWAKRQGVEWLARAEEVAEKADAIVLLAPDNAEVHLDLARRVFPAGKPTYVDKTFADSIATAQQMIELAAKHGTPLFSSSALRYAPALVEYIAKPEAAEAIDAEGQGPAEWERYGIHTVEPLVTLFGPDLKRLRTGGQGALFRVELEWKDGRTGLATVNGYGGVSFGMRITSEQGSTWLDLNDARFYNGLLDAMATFLKTGESPIPISTTLMVVTILEKALESRRKDGAWVTL